MTYDETMALLFVAKKLYPRDKSLDRDAKEMAEIGDAWAEMLRDIPFELGKAAVAAHAAGSPYAPAISEIRAYARKMTEPPQLSPDEAWEKASWAIRRFGSGPYKVYPAGKYPFELAREALPPEVWRVMEMMGYRYMCKSEKPETIRSQFIEAWERQQKRKEEQANMLPFLPEGLKEKAAAIAETAGGDGTPHPALRPPSPQGEGVEAGKEDMPSPPGEGDR